MNCSINFGGGDDPRHPSKPTLSFDKLGEFRMKSYTCLRCCRKVELIPGVYIQKKGSDDKQNPQTSLLCTACFNLKKQSEMVVLDSDTGSSSTAEEDGEEMDSSCPPLLEALGLKRDDLNGHAQNGSHAEKSDEDKSQQNGSADSCDGAKSALNAIQLL